jgi:hypothetical protein
MPAYITGLQLTGQCSVYNCVVVASESVQNLVNKLHLQNI